VLHCGHENVDKGGLTLLKDVGKIIEIPYHCYLIEDSEVNILVDTSASVRWRELHPESLIKLWPVYMTEEERPDRMLERIGFSTNDIDYVINTHLHYDHCGNNEMFSKSTFLVNEAEMAHSIFPGWWESIPYVKEVFDLPKLKYKLVKGDSNVVPGVTLIQTPGHTEGHQSVIVDLENTGPVALAGDAIYLPENLEDPILPGLYVDARRYADSMQKLKDIVDRKRGTLLLSHSRQYLSPQGWKPLEGRVHTFD
jgi:N-acyl homoserine lactone hydrolase